MPESDYKFKIGMKYYFFCVKTKFAIFACSVKKQIDFPEISLKFEIVYEKTHLFFGKC